MLIGMVYRLGRWMLSALGTAARGDSALLAEVLALRHENAVLHRQVARVRYEPADRAWFAALSALIPKARWSQVFPVTPATLLAWHRRLIAGKYTPTNKPRGRPRTRPAVITLILRMARDNPLWGHERIAGELIKLGHKIVKSTVWQILRAPRKRLVISLAEPGGIGGSISGPDDLPGCRKVMGTKACQETGDRVQVWERCARGPVRYGEGWIA
jgi:putative transposase